MTVRSAHDHGLGKMIAIDHEDHDVVREQEYLPPHQPVDVHRQRCRQLFDQALVGDEHVGALEDGRVDQVPDDQAERDVRQMLGQLELEQLRVQPAHRDRGDAGGDGDPERAEHRPPVALLDVLPTQVCPQLAAREAVDEVTPRARHRPGLGGCIGERHGFSNLSRLPCLRSRTHSARPLGSRRDTRKYQPNRNHSCGSSLRNPGWDNR